MPKQPKFDDFIWPNSAQNRTSSKDLMKLEHIVSALEYLYREAGQTNCQEIQMIVEATFNTVLAAYYLILRNQTQSIG